MDVRLVNLILAALSNVLLQLGFKSVVRSKVFAQKQFIDGLGVSVIVELTSHPPGNIVFNMKHETAKRLASVMLNGEAVEQLDALAQSAVCEMINMVISDATSSLNKSGINIQVNSPALSQYNSKIRVCNNNCNYIGVEMVVDQLVIGVGIGLN